VEASGKILQLQQDASLSRVIASLRAPAAVKCERNLPLLRAAKRLQLEALTFHSASLTFFLAFRL